MEMVKYVQDDSIQIEVARPSELLFAGLLQMQMSPM